MSLLETMRERRDAITTQLNELIGAVESRDDKNFTEDEGKRFDSLRKDARDLRERIGELEDEQRREDAAAETRRQAGSDAAGSAQVTDPPVYIPDGRNGHSYFKDLGKRSLTGDRDADDRLRRHAKAMADKEARALGNTNAAGGSGGELAPPDWLVNEFVKLVRPGRVTADLFKKASIPAGTSNIQIPKMLTGTAVGLQSTQNSSLTVTDLSTGSVGTGFTTIGGKQIVSQQLIDQSAVAFDQIVLQDLAAAYAAYFGAQIWAGTGTGSNNNSVLNGLSNATVSGGNVSTFTSASPTAALFYSKANGMLSSFITQRFAPPTHWIMHPRRWFWLMAQTDTAGRPLVVPQDVAVNPIASDGAGPDVQGIAGRFLGLPVVVDPNVVTNDGAGTNQDRVYLIKADDLWLFESDPRTESFREPYAESLGVLFRLYNYAGTILNRYSGISIAYMAGTGLVAPTF